MYTHTNLTILSWTHLWCDDRVWFPGTTETVGGSERTWGGKAEQEGRRRRRELKRGSHCRERSVETESKCEREDEKQKKRGGKVCHAFSGEEQPHGAVDFSPTDLWSKDEKAPLELQLVAQLVCLSAVWQLFKPLNLHKLHSSTFLTSRSYAAGLGNLQAMGTAAMFFSSSPLKEVPSPPFPTSKQQL